MTAPFVLRASGSAGGQTWTLYSGASAADVGGTLNITPFTDLIVANVAGQLAKNYFANGDFSSLTATQLAAESAKLRDRLQPILSALGVDSTVDLLHTPFTPLADALDKALDMIRISYDTAGTTATLTNIVTSQTITDSLTIQAAAESDVPILNSTTNVEAAGSDIAAIQAALNAYANLFATALPTAEQVKAKLTSGFFSSDMTSDAFAASELDSFNLGRRFIDVQIKRFDYTTTPATPRANVAFTVTDAKGVIVGREQTFRMRKVNGSWLLHGNRQCVNMKVVAHMVKSATSTGNSTSSGLEFQLEDTNPGNCGTNRNVAVAYAIVKGPGLPGDGLKYVPPALGGEFVIEGGSTAGYYPIVSSADQSKDAAISGIADNAAYSVTLFDASGATIPDDTNSFVNVNGAAVAGDSLFLMRRPLTWAELAVATDFPSFTAPTLTQLANYSGGALDIAATGMNPSNYGWIILTYNATATAAVEQDLLPSSNGAISVSLTLPVVAASTITRRQIRLANIGAFDRSFMSILQSGN